MRLAEDGENCRCDREQAEPVVSGTTEAAVQRVRSELSLFEVHTESGNFLHFPITRKLCVDDEERTEDAEQVLIGVLDSLLTAFNERFVDFASINDACCLFASPFTAILTYVNSCRRRLVPMKLRCKKIESLSRLCWV